MKKQNLLNNDSDLSQKHSYFFRIVPTKLLIHKSVLKMVHPLTRFKISLEKNLNKCDQMKQWVYAGTHNGVVDIDDQKLSFQIQQTQRLILCSLKLHELKYNNQDQLIVGKHNLLIQNYIKRFKEENKSFSQEKAQVSPDFILCYDIYLEQTREGLEVLTNQHQRQLKQKGIRVRKPTQIQSNISSTFSESINEIEVKGQNRFTNYNKIVRKNAQGSQRKILFGFDQENFNKFLYTTEKFNPKTPKLDALESPTIFNQLQMKKLISEDVDETLNNSKQINLFKKSSGTIRDSMNQRIRKKLMEDNQKKKQQFKLKLMEAKKVGNQMPRPNSQRFLVPSNSNPQQIRATVKLSQSLRLPKKSPWQKKQEQRKKVRNKWVGFIILGILLIILFYVMHPAARIKPEKPEKKLKGKHFYI